MVENRWNAPKTDQIKIPRTNNKITLDLFYKIFTVVSNTVAAVSEPCRANHWNSAQRACLGLSALMTLNTTTLCYYAERCYAECNVLFIVMLNIIVLSAVFLIIIMLSVVGPQYVELVLCMQIVWELILCGQVFCELVLYMLVFCERFYSKAFNLFQTTCDIIAIWHSAITRLSKMSFRNMTLKMTLKRNDTRQNDNMHIYTR